MRIIYEPLPLTPTPSIGSRNDLSAGPGFLPGWEEVFAPLLSNLLGVNIPKFTCGMQMCQCDIEAFQACETNVYSFVVIKV